jgi:mono/diheme cytochrome c family protein
MARSIRDGVYTTSQAERGRQRFHEICIACHTVSEHTGKRFMVKWADTTLGDLFGVMSKTMPEGDPGSLEPADYAAIIAFILNESGYQEGRNELPPDLGVLKSIRIEPAIP